MSKWMLMCNNILKKSSREWDPSFSYDFSLAHVLELHLYLLVVKVKQRLISQVEEKKDSVRSTWYCVGAEECHNSYTVSREQLCHNAVEHWKNMTLNLPKHGEKWLFNIRIMSFYVNMIDELLNIIGWPEYLRLISLPSTGVKKAWCSGTEGMRVAELANLVL